MLVVLRAERGSEGNNTFIRPVVSYPYPPVGSLDRPLMSASADGFHSASVKNGPTVVDGLFEGMPDDGKLYPSCEPCQS